jgi:hypothetical protein
MLFILLLILELNII